MPPSDLNIVLDLPTGKRIYFAGDFHLGFPNREASRKREDLLVSWLSTIQKDAKAVFLMGDQFDFWFEYNHVVPAGYVRFLGKIAEMTDAGIQVFMFRGNHDMWTRGYWADELGVTVISDTCILQCGAKRFYLHHGDGLGKGERAYKILRKLFRASWSAWLFERFHPNFGFFIATSWSRKSRKAQGNRFNRYMGNDKELLYQFASNMKTEYDYYIFGHRHLEIDVNVHEHSRYINTGTWLKAPTYAVFDGKDVQLTEYLK